MAARATQVDGWMSGSRGHGCSGSTSGWRDEWQQGPWLHGQHEWIMQRGRDWTAGRAVATHAGGTHSTSMLQAPESLWHTRHSHGMYTYMIYISYHSNAHATAGQRT